MRGDLQDQLNRAQASNNADNTTEKIIVAVAIFVAIAFLAGAIGFLAFFVNTADKFVNAEAQTNINPEQASRVSELSGQLIDNLTGSTTSGSSYSSKYVDNSNFEYGTVSGNKYYSSFSGVTFNAPSDWIVTSYASSIASSSPKDLTASGNAMKSSVIIQYENMKSAGYTSVDDALEATMTLATSTNNKLISNTASASWGGNSFKGIVYQKEYYTDITVYEVLVAQVNGYALKITISSDSQDSVNTIKSYFS